MPSYFKSNATDLDNIFVPRSDTTLGAPASPTNAFYSSSTVLEAKYVRYTELSLAEPGTPLVSATGFKYNTKDLHFTYIPPADVHKMCAYLTADGLAKYGYGRTLWTNGSAAYFNGIGDSIGRSNPTRVGTATIWNSLASGHSMHGGVQTDGTVWIWGAGFTNYLGFNDGLDKSVPTKLGTLTNWKQLSISRYNTPTTQAVKTDGSLWAWGDGSSGVLGTGNESPAYSPVRIGTLTNWAQVSVSSPNLGVYYGCAAAVKTDGSIWSWGNNEYGQLGHGNIINKSSPVRIGALTDWKSVSCGSSHVLSVKTDGSLWAWGANYSGELGLGNTISRSSPVRIGALATWSNALAVGNNYSSDGHSFGSKTDGSLWAWGNDGNVYGGGYLGLGAPVSRSSPVRIGALTNWSTIMNGFYFSTHAVKTDGTLWAWGSNPSGKLGVGDSIDRSSPTQVGSSTKWTTVATGFAISFAVMNMTCP